jgi:predicted RNA binding protein YcfA (HicA-like mRNA interferase family)
MQRLRNSCVTILHGRRIIKSFPSTVVGSVKVRAILELLADHGWEITTTRGSHRQLKHPTERGRVTVAGKPSDDLHPKTAASILRQAGLRQ